MADIMKSAMKAILMTTILTGVLTTMTAQARTIRPVANDFITVFESPDPQRIYAYSPGIAPAPAR